MDIYDDFVEKVSFFLKIFPGETIIKNADNTDNADKRENKKPALHGLFKKF